ncbi:translation initiation factor eIF-2B beta subunit [Dictyostelium purpureum]|uniref:Translation initiation factor eIF2B subunit beta n=1 Tax=Dictyostelium purpureum TaxID=5786 RepID=F0ZPC0_DICPU|nr:translation initiation factor eIF-2B beta subunit [Dictyostelium purpureum]EGC34218.1 translation initiation factor eIF-2B beta subunit [Dictyostelium purpureum]|eukprot:XP_003289270.1 translation initiation factor eIF-2B beta subunit [Dictyostelium purpureum]
MERQLETFILHLKRKNVVGSYQVSRATAELLRHWVSKEKWSNAKTLIEAIRAIGKRLIDAQPLEFCIGNIVRRVLFIIREEYLAIKKNTELESATSSTTSKSPSSSASSSTTTSPTPASPQTTAVHNLSSSTSATSQLRSETSSKHLLSYEDNEDIDFTENFPRLKAAIIDSVNELIDELEGLHRNVADQAIEHIHSNETIMTLGCSKTVEEFLKEAARKRSFKVIVVETSPSLEGQKTALTLSKASIDTTLITDSAVFAMMSRVNKVIIGTHAVMANGGLIATSGTHLLAVAAKYHSVPIVVCTGLYKLCPLYAYDQDTFNNFGSPGEYLKFEEAEYLEHVHSYNPTFDYITPDLISLFITNIGGHNPDYLYRLIQEYYDPRDSLEDDQ